MNESQRAIELFGELWSLSPDVRFGQLMAHLCFLGEARINRGLGYIEDDELIAVMYRHKAELQARLPGASPSEEPPSGAELSVSGSSTLQVR